MGGFLGLGGGIVLVPFLTVLVGMEMHQAVALSLSAIMANSIVSSNEYLKKDFVEFKLVIPLAVFASLGAVAGSNVSRYIPAGYLKIVFSVFLLYTIYSLLRKKENSSASTAAGREPSLSLVCLISFLAGVVSSLTGVGGGILLIPAVYLVLSYSIHVARGSSAFTIGIIATAGSVVYLIGGVLTVEYVGVTMLGMMAGAWLGGRTGVKAKSMVVKYVFAVVLFYLAVRMFYEGVS